MNKLINKLIISINKIDTRIFIFAILCCNFLSFVLNGNEEGYLALAKQYYDPTWIPGSFTFTEWPGHRIIFQTVVGYFLSFLSFETVTFCGRLINFFLFSLPLARLFKLLRISNLGILFFLQIFYFSQQTFFAGEWIFRGFEPKTISYIFIFYSLFYILKEKYIKSVIFTLFGTYLHVLVGGWFFVITILYLLIIKHKLKDITMVLLIYISCVSPFFIYLANEIIFNYKVVINDINLNWVTVYFRLPHHVGLFKNRYYFFINHLPGILTSLSWFFLCVFYFKKSKDTYIRKINLLNIVVFSILFVSIFIGCFDSTGMFLKYFPFRISALSMFLIIIQIILILKRYAIKEAFIKYVQVILFVLCIPALCYATVKNIGSNYFNFIKSHPEQSKLTEFIKKNTDPKDVFMLVGFEDLSFIRKTKRDRFVVYDFGFVGGDKQYEWYIRLIEKNKVEKNIVNLFNILDKYRINYILSKVKYDVPRLSQVYQNGSYYVYKIESE